MRSKCIACRSLLAVVALAAACCAQEEIVRQLLGTDADCLLNTHDVLAVPGQTVALRVTLDLLPFVGETPESEIRIRMGEAFSASVLTDPSGQAVTTFTPRSPGDYVFTVDVAPNDAFEILPRPMELRVTCREADTPIIIVDLDDTVVATDVLRLAAGAAQPVPGSLEALQRLAPDYTVVYLTFRPDVLGLRSKRWLKRHHYPAGPLLMPSKADLFRGSGGFKKRRLRQLRESFDKIAIGVGDKISDVQAYQDNDLAGFLLLPVRDFEESEDYFDLIEDLDKLDRDAQVVRDWQEILDVVYGGKSFSRSAAQEALLEKATALEAREKRQRREGERKKKEKDGDDGRDDDDDDEDREDD